MTYNANVIREQGASVLRIASAGSLVIQAGGKFTSQGTIDNSGQISTTSALTVATAGSLTVESGGALFLGTVQLLFGAITSPPVVGAVPGSIYLRSDGSVSNMYVNVSTGAAGSVWTATCVNAP